MSVLWHCHQLYLRVFGAGREVPAYLRWDVPRGAAPLQMLTQIMSGHQHVKYNFETAEEAVSVYEVVQTVTGSVNQGSELTESGRSDSACTKDIENAIGCKVYASESDGSRGWTTLPWPRDNIHTTDERFYPALIAPLGCHSLPSLPPPFLPLLIFKPWRST